LNTILAKHRPKGGDGKTVSKEEWEKTWANSGHVLEPLAKTLAEMQESLGRIDPEDFDCPNHYAKLVADGVRRQTLQAIIDLLPDSAKGS
jgi:hypothetical protein